MPKFNDLTGRRFGNLTVISFAGKNSGDRSLWNCKCDCGNFVLKGDHFFRKGKEFYCGKYHPTKVCTHCGIDKDKSEFHKSNTAKNSLNPRCKECLANWYQENKDTIQREYKELYSKDEYRNRRKANNKRSRTKNRDQQRAYKRRYDKTDAVKERKKAHHNRRKQCDPNYVIKRRLRGRVRDIVRRAIVSPKGIKYKSSLVLLGCDVEFFKNYLESKFYDGMSWDNISKWHIDHIKPCSKFDLSKYENQKICFHYTNLQPLWEKDNLEKSYLYEETTQEGILAPPNLSRLAS